MRVHRLLATVGVGVLSLTTVACHSKTAASAAATSARATSAPAPAATAAAAASASVAPVNTAPSSAAAAGSGAVSFDGSYSGTLNVITCVGSGATTTAQFNASFTGKPEKFPGTIGSAEFGFEGPDRTQFDSGFLSKALDTDGNGFVLDGIVAKDSSGKSVTMHGTLRCS